MLEAIKEKLRVLSVDTRTALEAELDALTMDNSNCVKLLAAWITGKFDSSFAGLVGYDTGSEMLCDVAICATDLRTASRDAVTAECVKIKADFEEQKNQLRAVMGPVKKEEAAAGGVPKKRVFAPITIATALLKGRNFIQAMQNYTADLKTSPKASTTSDQYAKCWAILPSNPPAPTQAQSDGVGLDSIYNSTRPEGGRVNAWISPLRKKFKEVLKSYFPPPTESPPQTVLEFDDASGTKRKWYVPLADLSKDTPSTTPIKLLDHAQAQMHIHVSFSDSW
jgi:hypothetical protein